MPDNNRNDSTIYEIRFRGTIHPRWTTWFEGYELVGLENGDTLLRGMVRDQSELRGVLEKLANLNLPLISVNPTNGDPQSP